jgi:phosphatidylinositol alpha-mannosyltransferase
VSSIVSPPLRIGICAPYDLAREGGVNSHIRAQAQALRRLGHDVTVFGASSRPRPADAVVVSPCLSLVIGGTDTPIGFDPVAWFRVGRLYEERRFEIVHVHEPLMPLVPWIAVGRSPVPVVATFHTHREAGHRWYPRYRRMFEPLMSRLQVKLAVSDAARRTVADVFPGEYQVVPNGIEVERFFNPAPRPSSMPLDRLHVVYVGRLEPRKGVDRLLRAVGPAWPPRDGLQRPRLVVVGDGPNRADLEQLARTQSVDVLFAGRVSDEELPGYVQAADVVCSPALGGESFGIVLLEALAAGRPAVATRIPGYQELAAGMDSIRLVLPDDVEALAHEIWGLLSDRRLREELGSKGPTFARRYGWDSIAGRLEATYRQLTIHN